MQGRPGILGVFFACGFILCQELRLIVPVVVGVHGEGPVLLQLPLILDVLFSLCVTSVDMCLDNASKFEYHIRKKALELRMIKDLPDLLFQFSLPEMVEMVVNHLL